MGYPDGKGTVFNMYKVCPADGRKASQSIECGDHLSGYRAAGDFWFYRVQVVEEQWPSARMSLILLRNIRKNNRLA